MQIGALNVFTAGTTIAPAQVNQNFDDIKSAFNGSALLTDVARNVTVTHNWGAAQNFAAGTAAAPSIYLVDANLGFYRSALGEISVAVGGVKIATFHAGGIRLAAGKSITYE